MLILDNQCRIVRCRSKHKLVRRRSISSGWCFNSGRRREFSQQLNLKSRRKSKSKRSNNQMSKDLLIYSHGRSMHNLIFGTSDTRSIKVTLIGTLSMENWRRPLRFLEWIAVPRFWWWGVATPNSLNRCTMLGTLTSYRLIFQRWWLNVWSQSPLKRKSS